MVPGSILSAELIASRGWMEALGMYHRHSATVCDPTDVEVDSGRISNLPLGASLLGMVKPPCVGCNAGSVCRHHGLS